MPARFHALTPFVFRNFGFPSFLQRTHKQLSILVERIDPINSRADRNGALDALVRGEAAVMLREFSGAGATSGVGLVGFEPTASASRTQRSTKLSHSPNLHVP